MQHGLGAVDVLDEALDAAGEGEVLALRPSRSSISSIFTPLLRNESSRMRLARMS
jgi:hypothetical protein